MPIEDSRILNKPQNRGKTLGKYTLYWTRDDNVVEYTKVWAPSRTEAVAAARWIAENRGYSVDHGRFGAVREWGCPEVQTADVREVDII